MTERRWTITLVVVGLLVFAGFVIFSLYAINTVWQSAQDIQAWRDQYNSIARSSERIVNEQGDDAASNINALPGLVLPNGATDVHFARQGTVNVIYWLRFDTAPAGLSDFINDTCFDTLEDDYTPAFAYDSDPDVRILLDWWQPNASGRGGQCMVGDVTFEMLVADADDLATVYLEIIAR